MIRTIPLPFEKVLEKLSPGTSIGIIGCGDCAAVLGTGGTKQVEMWKTQLEKIGTVPFAVVVEAPCDQRSLKSLVKMIDDFSVPETILILACPAGAQSLTDLLRSQGDARRVLVGLAGDGLGWIDGRTKAWHPCRLCNPCPHEPTVEACLVGRCPLERIDGPCQNRLAEDRCPLLPGTVCVWLDPGPAVSTKG
jgi:hypothetical protein